MRDRPRGRYRSLARQHLALELRRHVLAQAGDNVPAELGVRWEMHVSG